MCRLLCTAADVSLTGTEDQRAAVGLSLMMMMVAAAAVVVVVVEELFDLESKTRRLVSNHVQLSWCATFLLASKAQTLNFRGALLIYWRTRSKH